MSDGLSFYEGKGGFILPFFVCSLNELYGVVCSVHLKKHLEICNDAHENVTHYPTWEELLVADLHCRPNNFSSQ